jgi:hypothetical protein
MNPEKKFERGIVQFGPWTLVPEIEINSRPFL